MQNLTGLADAWLLNYYQRATPSGIMYEGYMEHVGVNGEQKKVRCRGPDDDPYPGCHKVRNGMMVEVAYPDDGLKRTRLV